MRRRIKTDSSLYKLLANNVPFTAMGNAWKRLFYEKRWLCKLIQFRFRLKHHVVSQVFWWWSRSWSVGIDDNYSWSSHHNSHKPHATTSSSFLLRFPKVAPNIGTGCLYFSFFFHKTLVSKVFLSVYSS